MEFFNACVVTMNTQVHQTLKTTPYEVVFGIKPFSAPVQSFSVTKEQEDLASDTSEISECEISDSSCSSDQNEKHKKKQKFKEARDYIAGTVAIAIARKLIIFLSFYYL